MQWEKDQTETGRARLTCQTDDGGTYTALEYSDQTANARTKAWVVAWKNGRGKPRLFTPRALKALTEGPGTFPAPRSTDTPHVFPSAKKAKEAAEMHHDRNVWVEPPGPGRTAVEIDLDKAPLGLALEGTTPPPLSVVPTPPPEIDTDKDKGRPKPKEIGELAEALHTEDKARRLDEVVRLGSVWKTAESEYDEELKRKQAAIKEILAEVLECVDPEKNAETPQGGKGNLLDTATKKRAKMIKLEGEKKRWVEDEKPKVARAEAAFWLAINGSNSDQLPLPLAALPAKGKTTKPKKAAKKAAKKKAKPKPTGKRLRARAARLAKRGEHVRFKRGDTLLTGLVATIVGGTELLDDPSLLVRLDQEYEVGGAAVSEMSVPVSELTAVGK